jgi:hypothetical protein
MQLWKQNKEEEDKDQAEQLPEASETILLKKKKVKRFKAV